MTDLPYVRPEGALGFGTSQSLRGMTLLEVIVPCLRDRDSRIQEKFHISLFHHRKMNLPNPRTLCLFLCFLVVPSQIPQLTLPDHTPEEDGWWNPASPVFLLVRPFGEQSIYKEMRVHFEQEEQHIPHAEIDWEILFSSAFFCHAGIETKAHVLILLDQCYSAIHGRNRIYTERQESTVTFGFSLPAFCGADRSRNACRYHTWTGLWFIAHIQHPSETRNWTPCSAISSFSLFVMINAQTQFPYVWLFCQAHLRVNLDRNTFLCNHATVAECSIILCLTSWVSGYTGKYGSSPVSLCVLWPPKKDHDHLSSAYLKKTPLHRLEINIARFVELHGPHARLVWGKHKSSRKHKRSDHISEY